MMAALGSSGAKRAAPATPTIVYAVRHAEKGGVSGDKDPPLGAAGAARARTLAQVLRDVRFDAIYVSPYRRTQQTAAPVAQAQSLTPVVLPPDTVAAHILKHDAGKTILVVGHSNTVPKTLAGLGARDSIAVADTQYDNLFILTRRDQQVMLHHLHYGLPDAPATVEPQPAPADSSRKRG
jgi:broad specificity phosphatase PhoE